MHRITGTYVDPNANGSGKAGFTHGTPGVTGATTVTAAWANAVQEEIALTIEASGATLSSGSNAQLKSAVQGLAGYQVLTPTSIADVLIDNYGPTGWGTSGIIRLTSAHDSQFRGFDSNLTYTLRHRLLINATPDRNFLLIHNHGGQAAGNAIWSPTGRDYQFRPGTAVMICHDPTTSMWRIIGDTNAAFDLSESVTFLSRDYDWTGTHSFGDAVDFTDTVSSATGYGIANAGVGEDFNFTGTKPVRPLVFSWLGGGYTSEWSVAGAPYVRAGSPNVGVYYRPIHLPHGAVVTQFSSRYFQQADTAVDLKMELVRKPLDWSADVSIATLNAGVFAINDIVAATGLSHTVDNTVSLYFLKATASDSAGDENYLYWASVVIDDPGPRNY
jgi:hypothetical protein